MKTKFRNLTVSGKKRKAYPVRTVCRNCGTQQISRYCHNCGQDLFSGSERSLKEITASFLDTILALDNKLIVTLKYLTFYPGKLTKEFFAGKIASYVFPAKLFWFMSILFFATLSFGPDIRLKKSDIEDTIRIVEKNISAKTMKVTDKDKVVNEVKDYLDNRIITNESNKLLISYAPYAMFLLIPFFALIVQLFFYRKCRYYASQMIFSLHFHAFAFMLFSILNILMLLFPSLQVSSAIAWMYLFVPAIYFAISLYVVYRPKKRHLLWKLPVIALLYLFAMLVVVVLLALVIGYMMYGADFVKEILAGIFRS